MNSLRSLADREQQLCQRVAAFAGTIEDKAAQLAESNIGAAYRQLHRDYWQLARTTPEEAVRLEALKRLLFLNWSVLVEPGIYTGIDVDAQALRASWELLEEYVAEKRLDAELTWMLAAYAWWLDMLPAYGLSLPAIGAFREATDFDLSHAPDRQLPPHTMSHRGQMGLYWRSRHVEAPAGPEAGE